MLWVPTAMIIDIIKCGWVLNSHLFIFGYYYYHQLPSLLSSFCFWIFILCHLNCHINLCFWDHQMYISACIFLLYYPHIHIVFICELGTYYYTSNIIATSVVATFIAVFKVCLSYMLQQFTKGLNKFKFSLFYRR